MELKMINKNLNKIQKLFSSHILLYHSTFSEIPREIEDGLHNIHPEVLFKQISWYKNNFDIVKVDELFNSSNIKGKMSITFDDGYQSVFDEAIPILKELNVPCTIFINGSSINNSIFWRDKIRFIINKNLIEDFLKYFKNEIKISSLTKYNFYKQTKSPSINSKYIEGLCDKFLKERHTELKLNNYCITSLNQLVDDSLVSYGNHSYSHYVLSSLSTDEQENEISKNHKILESCSNKSKIFAIPFGGPKDFNSKTIEIIKKYGYEGVLFSQDKINLLPNKKNAYGLERFMAPNSDSGLHKFLPKVLLRSVLL
tara:strand:+ start:1997 stop:2932 length:936 start_codon:yes stop_codon:yes gene_type:complete